MVARGTSGGIWFRAGEAELHLGVEEPFQPARRGHPALLADGLDELASRCEQGGVEVEWDDRYPGVRRFYIHDPFGNRIEIMQRD
jgi:catechol 2,3-dioxygenase-like lactoylglutathione lyase family enzyme